MRIGDGSERGVADRREIRIDKCVLANLARIVDSRGHDEIVRMLAVGDRQAVRRLAGLKQQRVAAIGYGCGFQAEHEYRFEGGP